MKLCKSVAINYGTFVIPDFVINEVDYYYCYYIINIFIIITVDSAYNKVGYRTSLVYQHLFLGPGHEVSVEITSVITHFGYNNRKCLGLQMILSVMSKVYCIHDYKQFC